MFESSVELIKVVFEFKQVEINLDVDNVLVEVIVVEDKVFEVLEVFVEVEKVEVVEEI